MTDIEPAPDLAQLSADLREMLRRVDALTAIEPAAVNANGLPGNVAAGELITSAWGNATANFINKENASHLSQGPYSGAWPGGSAYTQLHTRTGHIQIATSAYGDGTFNFASPFPNGVISVQLTAVDAAKNVFWWPMVTTINLASCSFWAVSVSGYPYATGHPPSLPNVWTMVGTITFDYIAYGV